MKGLFLLVLLFRIPACVDPDQSKFVDGVDLSESGEYRTYEYGLRVLLTVPDSMLNAVEPVVPPGCRLGGRIVQDTLADGSVQMRVYPFGGGEILFRDSFDPVTLEERVAYRFRGYDSKNGIAYLVERRGGNGFFRFFGICLGNGNQFTVYDKDSRGAVDRMFSWEFSPDMGYLLKSGDLDDGSYGWSLVNLKDGVEGKAHFERFEEFVTEIRWTGIDRFSYVLTKIPFRKGHRYDRDYGFFYSVMEGNPFPWVELSGDVIYPVRYTLDVKGRLISERLLKIET